MNNIKKISKFLNSKFPYKNSEEWDSCGLTHGDEKKPVETALVTLDLTTDAFEKAIANKASLIITHHPFIFESEEEDIKKAPYKKELLHRIKNTNIGIISIHTCYDNAQDGMSNELASRLGLKVLKLEKYGVMLQTKNITMDKLSSMLEDEFQTPISITNVNEKSTFKKVAIIPGSGSIEDILKFHNNGAEIILTSDIKWSDWITVNEMGINLCQISHGIEELFVEHIKRLIKQNFKGVNVISNND